MVTTPNSTPSSIRNRRRTSSTTAVTIPLTSQTSRSGAGPADQVGVRDRNPSEDMSNPSRCTTPAAYEVPPYEPRQFPLSRSTYEAMVNNTEAATAVFIGMQVLPNANTQPVKANILVLFLSKDGDFAITPPKKANGETGGWGCLALGC